MATIVDLGQKVKAKYPGQYDDLPDDQVGMKVKAKYPGQYDDFTDVPTSSPSPSPTPAAKTAPNWLQSIMSPFSKTVATGVQLAEGVGYGAKGLFDKLRGRSDLASQDVQKGLVATDPNRPVDLGYPGQVKPVTNTLDAIGTGAEIGSYLLPAGGAVSAVKAGAAIGGVGALGRSLQNASQSTGSFLQKAGQVAKDTAVGTLVGAATAGALDKVQKAIPKVQTWLEEQNLRLTPVQRQKLGTRLEDATKTIVDNQITGTPAQRFQKATNLVNNTEAKFQGFLEQHPTFVSKDALVQRLQGLKTVYSMSDEADIQEIGKQIDRAVSRLDQYGSEIPTARLNNLKRSIYENAYNRAGDKVLDWVEHDVAGVYKNAIEDAANSVGGKIEGLPLKQFNQKFGNLLQAQKLLKIAQTRADSGLMSRLIASFAGGTIGEAMGGPVGAAVGAEAGNFLTSKATTLARSTANRALSALPRANPVTAAKGISALFRPRPPQ